MFTHISLLCLVTFTFLLDCEPYIGAKSAWSQWTNTFDNFEQNWSPQKFYVSHQPARNENLSFVYQRVLFVILHLVSDYFDIESERKKRHEEELAWAREQISIHEDVIDAVVLIGHSPPSILNRDFFRESEGGISETIRKLGVPTLYIHGSGHKFVEEDEFNKVENFLRIQVPGRMSPAVKVTSEHSTTFWFDFRDDSTTTDCCVDGWPSISRRYANNGDSKNGA